MPNPLKIMLVGDSKAGKTGLIERYVKSHKPDLNHYQATTGASFCIKDSKLDIANNSQDLPLQIWDTAGDESLRVFGHAFFNNANAIILMVSLQAGETKQAFLRRAKLSIATHYEELNTALVKVPPVFLMLGKTDLITENLSEIETELTQLAQQYDMRLTETGKVFCLSALTSSDAEIAAPFLTAAKAGINFDKAMASSAPKQQASPNNSGGHKKSFAIYNFLASLLRYLDKLSGAVVGGILAIFAGLLLFNPVAIFFLSIRAAFFIVNTASFAAVILLAFSPVIAGLGGIIIAPLLSLYLGLRDGWHDGLIAGIKMPVTLFNTFTYATSNEKSDRFNLPKLRKADVIFGFLIMTLVVAVIAMVLFPATFGLAAALPVAIANLGLTGLTTQALAAIVGGITFIAASTLYGIGSHIYDSYVAHQSNYIFLGDKNTTPLDAEMKHSQSYAQMAKKMPAKLKTAHKLDMGPTAITPSPIVSSVAKQEAAVRAAQPTVKLNPA